jgi:hypothetical protein
LCSEEEKDIFQDLAATPPMEGEKAGSPHPAAGSSPEPDALTPAAPLEAEVPESRGGGERMDAAEEGRRARLRQVRVYARVSHRSWVIMTRKVFFFFFFSLKKMAVAGLFLNKLTIFWNDW